MGHKNVIRIAFSAYLPEKDEILTPDRFEEPAGLFEVRWRDET